LFFVLLGHFSRKRWYPNYSGYTAAFAQADLTGGVALSMYVALFIGFFDYEALSNLLKNNVAQAELFAVIIIGFVQQWGSFRRNLTGKHEA
jgi:hypothetical protein